MPSILSINISYNAKRLRILFCHECPKCGEKMDEALNSYGNNVGPDHCPYCGYTDED